jgi:sialate O-acetylesterase
MKITMTHSVAVLCWALSIGPGFSGQQPVADEPPALTLEAQCAAPFGDNAVLQQGIPLPVWGTSLPGAKVTITYGEMVKTTRADKAGAWRVVLDPLTATRLTSIKDRPAGTPMTIVTERGGETATRVLKNLVAGEVWLCAGQSNIAGKLKTNRPYRYPPESRVEANYPGLRHMLGPGQPWADGSPETVGQFKKVSFYFARPLMEGIRVPVGLIPAAVGGSRIETWLNREPYERGKNYDQHIVPVIGFGIRGAVWYQGESNTKDGLGYLPKLRALIEGWRAEWGLGDFPVYFVQLPGRGDPDRENAAGGGGWPDTRQAQYEALTVPNTGMAITIDIGDRSVHPPNKYDTGERLARLALHHTYGQKKVVPSGPLYKSHVIEGNTVRVWFHYAESGLMRAEKMGFAPPVPEPDKKLEWLAVQAKDGTWHWADGVIDGSELVVSSKSVTNPVAVRYAYVQRPDGCMLYNKDGLPVAPFSTSGPEKQP